MHSSTLTAISRVIRIQKRCENSFAVSAIKERHQRDKSYRVLNPPCRLQHGFVQFHSSQHLIFNSSLLLLLPKNKKGPLKNKLFAGKTQLLVLCITQNTMLSANLTCFYFMFNYQKKKKKKVQERERLKFPFSIQVFFFPTVFKKYNKPS